MVNETSTPILREGAKHCGVTLSDADVERFSLYIEELQRWSKIANLVSQTDTQTVIRKHILDSLAIFPLIPRESRVLDLGSGAGFPGLILAILGPSLDITLVEARRKRASFLKAVIRKTTLTNVRVYEGRAEKLVETVSFQGTFNVVVTRATWDLSEFLRLAAPCLREGGLALAMKGPQGEKELTDSDTHFQDSGFTLLRIYQYGLPFGQERRKVAVFIKEGFT